MQRAQDWRPMYYFQVGIFMSVLAVLYLKNLPESPLSETEKSSWMFKGLVASLFNGIVFFYSTADSDNELFGGCAIFAAGMSSAGIALASIGVTKPEVDEEAEKIRKTLLERYK